MTRHWSKVKDSGSRQTFVDGAQRDTQEGKPRIDLLSPFFLLRLGDHMANGAAKYNERNWEKGIADSRYFSGIMRHLTQWYLGMDDEDHLAAAAFGIMGIIHTQEAVPRGILPPSLQDMPDYGGEQGTPPDTPGHAQEKTSAPWNTPDTPIFCK